MNMYSVLYLVRWQTQDISLGTLPLLGNFLM